MRRQCRRSAGQAAEVQVVLAVDQEDVALVDPVALAALEGRGADLAAARENRLQEVRDRVVAGQADLDLRQSR